MIVRLMIDTILKLLEFVLGKFFPKITRSVSVEVRQFGYQFIENRSGDSIIVLGQYPSRYRAELRLTNRTNSVVYVKDISVSINGSRRYEQVQPKDKIRLDPHEYLHLNIIFPVPSDEIPDKEGTYNLEVVPTRGRKTRITATFSS